MSNHTVASDKRVLLAHGSGGRLSQELIREVFLDSFSSSILKRLDDSAAIDQQQGRLAFTTDSFVVNPIFFPGGDIGKLAVCGTVNDLAMLGAGPKYLSAGFIIEEGFPLADLVKIARSMQRTADEAGVEIVTGDTKVVESGKADGVFINTAGLGVIPPNVNISGSGARAGDKIILSGTIGEHGMAILGEREGFRFRSDIRSDCAPLNGLVSAILAVTPEVHCLRDATRGGLASVLNELAGRSCVAMRIEEDAIPISDAVRAACELVGYDALYVANEGKLVAVVASEVARFVLRVMRSHPYGREAAMIGEVIEGTPGRVTMRTRIGGARVIETLSGELLPRIC